MMSRCRSGGELFGRGAEVRAPAGRTGFRRLKRFTEQAAADSARALKVFEAQPQAYEQVSVWMNEDMNGYDI